MPNKKAAAKKKPGRPPAKRKYTRKLTPPVLVEDTTTQDYFVGELEEGFTPFRVSHPAFKLATDHAAKMKVGQSFVMGTKFKTSLRNWVNEHQPDRAYIISTLTTADKQVRVFRTK